MIAELAQWCLAMALSASALLGIISFVFLKRIHSQPSTQQTISLAWLSRAMVSSSLVVFGLVLLAFLALTEAFMVSDFSIRNVAENSNSLLPPFFRFAASWGSHEGSMLLWVLMLTGWQAAVACFSRQLAPRFRVRVLAILMLVSAAFLLFLFTASNPFERLIPPPAEGRDLNPLLQDIVMIIHPPMLYMGYVGFAVSYAFAMAALIERRLDATWARWSRPWANAAWGFLTLGILLGSWWAYRELGWGGWWFWDPVENASLMPWLAGTALIHSLAVTDKRDALKSWTVLLALTAFALSLLGTFLVRSGVLTSVHAFATDPKRGIFILALLLLVIGSSYVIYALRTQSVGMGQRFTVSSRESLLLSNNVLMSAALAAVMLGTLYPLVLEVVSAKKISVGPPYFEAVFAPILLPAVFLMALGPVSRWKSMSLPQILRAMLWPALIAVTCLALSWWAIGRMSLWLALGLIAGVGLSMATLEHAWRQMQAIGSQQPHAGLLYRAQRLGVSYWAMVMAHLGVAVFVLGVTLVKALETEKDLVMEPGHTEVIGPWRISFIGVDQVKGPNYVALHGVFELTQGTGKHIILLEPQKRHYVASGQVMTEASIESGLTGDVYISLGEPVESARGGSDAKQQAWSVRIYIKPFINWIWWGCVMMALGAFITLFDRRYRRQGSTPA